MTNKIRIFGIIGVVITLSGCTDNNIPTVENTSPFVDSYNIEETYEELEYNEAYGSTGALKDDDFTLQDMLYYAIQDEYAARAEYEYIMTTFQVTKPFSNIIKSEETHIALLLPLFETYQIPLIEDTSSLHILSINSVEEAYDIGVQAEILNIEMYNLFLTQEDLPDDVRDVFVKLRDASINHLEAFEKNASK